MNTFTSSGVLSVTAKNSCGISSARTLTISRNIPAQPGAITVSGGGAAVCRAESRTYAVPAVAGLTYNWVPPTGATITSGQGTNSINLFFETGFVAPGILSVIAGNTCGYSAARTLSISTNTPVPGTITGASTVCPGSVATYSVPAIAGVDSYLWNVPPGVAFTGQGTTSINVAWGSTGGIVSVYALNACGNSGLQTKVVSIISCLTTMEKSAANALILSQPKTTTDLLHAEIFPNPTTGNITVKFKGIADEKYRVMVTDMTGRVISNEGGNAYEGTNLHKIDLTRYAGGIYIITLQTAAYSEKMKVILK